MKDQILQFPDQLKNGLEVASNIKIKKDYKNIVVCGTGGSGIPGEILKFWQSRKWGNLIYKTHSEYDLPSWVSKQDLVVCISWSGETEETLSSYEAAIKLEADVLAITTGGRLASLSEKNNTPFVFIPDKGLKPRMGIGYMTAALFSVLGIKENIESVSLDTQNQEESGKNLAEKISSQIPLLYSSHNWSIIPGFWKILFNENCKIHAFWNSFPKLAHNELLGFTNKQKEFYPIFFIDKNDDPRINKDINAAIAILDEMSYNYSILNFSSGNNILETVLNSYVLGLWTTYYLAKKMVVDPEKTSLLDEFKKTRTGL